jgi:hypothetical protein
MLSCLSAEAIRYRSERVAVERRKLVIMLIAYGDDSADEKRRRVFAASAVAGSQDEWDDFAPKWLAKNPLERPFHAKDCDSDHGLFKGRMHEENKMLYAANVHLFRNSTLYGAGVSISIKDYWEVFPFAPEDEYWPYYMCFAGVLACISWVARKSIPPERVKVIFDHDPAKEADSLRIYEFVAKRMQRTEQLMDCLQDEVTFKNHRKEPGIQVADLLARETMKELDNEVQGSPRWPRQSLIELRRSNRFSTVMYTREKLEAYRHRADKIHGDPERGRAYKEWLALQGLRDSIHVRMRHMAESGMMNAD